MCVASQLSWIKRVWQASQVVPTAVSRITGQDFVFRRQRKWGRGRVARPSGRLRSFDWQDNEGTAARDPTPCCRRIMGLFLLKQSAGWSHSRPNGSALNLDYSIKKDVCLSPFYSFSEPKWLLGRQPPEWNSILPVDVQLFVLDVRVLISHCLFLQFYK